MSNSFCLICVIEYTRGGPKVTGLFQYLKIQIKYKFFKMKLVNFQRFAIFIQNFIKLSLVTTEIS